MITLRSILAFIGGCLICFLWMYSGNKISKKQNDDDFAESYSGKIFRAYVPETQKFLVIEFSNGVKHTLNFFALRELVEPNDSIKKEAKSFRFVIYKNSDPKDSI